MGINMESAGEEAGADFLRRLSVADAKVLLERTRKEKDAKVKEMQKMIGVRYRDLIESADKIVTMHSAAMRLETTLKEMPAEWQEMEVELASTLATSNTLSSSETQETPTSPTTVCLDSIQDQALFLVQTHENLWQLLDQGETFQALKLYQQAQEMYEATAVDIWIESFPFLPSLWASIQTFYLRMISIAHMCLSSRGKDASFYANNLAALCILEKQQQMTDLLDRFLKSRQKWLEFDTNWSERDSEEKTLTMAERQLRISLRTMVMTISHAQEIFLSTPLLDEYGLQLTPLQDELILKTNLSQWFEDQKQMVCQHATSTISHIPTIARIAQSQTKLVAIDTQYNEYKHTFLWHQISSESMFEVLFGVAFRKRTRDLVQTSFETAVEAMKQEVQTCIHTVSESSRRLDRLSCIRFYDFFDSIHTKVAGLKSKELQRVLMEEYIRSLFKFVLFLEAQYSYHSIQMDINSPDSSYFLLLANILTGIVSEFPSRVVSLFGEQTEDVMQTKSIVAMDQAIFERYAEQGSMTASGLVKALEEVDSMQATISFIDEELDAVRSLGLFGFHLVALVKRGESYPVVFVRIFRGLAVKYCEAWAKQLLQQKIQPLKEILQVEHYDQTNEEWIVSHEGWSEQVIEHDFPIDDEEEEDEEMVTEKAWLPWCETPTISSFLFSCCYALDEAYRLVRQTTGANTLHHQLMQELIRQVLIEQLTLTSVDVYDEAVTCVVTAKGKQRTSVLNFGECCMLQFLFDMYFVRATLGFSDFVRFGWGDEIDPKTASPSLARLKYLFDRMHDFVDPVDWEIYGPQLIENVVVQFRKSRLLFSSLSQASDINEINGKQIIVSAQDTRPIVRVAEPVSRFSLLPVPTTRRRNRRESDTSNTMRKKSLIH